MFNCDGYCLGISAFVNKERGSPLIIPFVCPFNAREPLNLFRGIDQAVISSKGQGDNMIQKQPEPTARIFGERTSDRATERERETETDRQTDRQTDRERERERVSTNLNTHMTHTA